MKKLFITFGVFLLTSLSFAQLNENFESGIPTNWSVINTGVGTNLWVANIGPACEGTTSALFNGRENTGAGSVREGWLVSDLVTVPDDAVLVFTSRMVTGSADNTTLQVKISINSSNFFTLQQWSDTNINDVYNACEQKKLDLSGFAGYDIKIAFVVTVNQPTVSLTGDIWILDEIKLVERCLEPTNIQVEQSGLDEAIISWDDPGNSDLFEVEIVHLPNSPTGIGMEVGPQTTYLATGLAIAEMGFSNNHIVYVRSKCSEVNSEWVGPLHFSITCRAPQNLIYNRNGTDAFITWDAGFNVQWEIEIAEVDQSFTDNGIILNTNSHTFTNLDPDKLYKVQVRSLCESNQQVVTSEWVSKRCIGDDGAHITTIMQFPDDVLGKVLCVDEPIIFTPPSITEITSHNWYFYNSNNDLIWTSNVAEPTFVFSQVGDYYCILEAGGIQCDDLFRYDFEIIPCVDCLNGEINHEETLCAGTDNFFWFSPSGTINFTDPELSFSWSVTHNGNPVPFETIDDNNTAINLAFASPGNYNIVLVVSDATCTQTIVKNVTIGSCSTGSCEDPANQYYVIGLFRDLLKHLKSQSSQTITNGYSCAELIALLPYINPAITNPAIYNFTNSSNTISFSFSSDASSPHVVFHVPSTDPNLLISLNFGGNYTDINNQTSFISNFFTIDGFFPTFLPVSGSSVSQINFCPDELNCVNHIAIVLDESTSITSTDAGRIRRQLKNFIEQQVVFNQSIGSQLRVSLIGLSDEDENVRTDHVINLLVNQANKQTFINWINKYKNRYNQGLPGVSSNSDYWNSGLFRAAQTDASLVILMTDGAQTGNLSILQSTIDLYSNGGNSNSNKHLHVIGLTKGYYIDGETNANRYGESFNPNLVKEVFFEEDDVEVANVENNTLAMRLTDFLRISLRYLIYGNNQFPTEADITQANYFSTDYSGHFNFKFLYDDPFFLSNGLFDFLESSCGERQYLEKCDDCYGVQLDVKKNYILSAWVHVDKMQQVISFKEETQSPSIEIKFTDEGEISLPTVTDGGIVYPGSVELFPQGNIIDGWQRIFGSFSVHPDTVFLEITLKNGSFSDAMLFDDIRIHPRDGSMKSFIYDEQNYRLMSELDENNYSTYYEYDAEGGLVRVKKETERGVKTIQESRSGSVIKN